MPVVSKGAPFPFKTVLGIEVALRPAALAGISELATINIDAIRNTLEKR